ncbi:MAG: ATP-binding cassette domain-containing protein, partial [Clostridiaceae bacterium]|nr:ATP-binding cassette domain-containing protein [Clostridiaceae bacterium]
MTKENLKNSKDGDDILVVNHLKKYFPISKFGFGKRRSYVKAVDDVSFTIKRGTTMGLVGESGCGKTTVGRTILRLIDVTDGQVLFDGRDLSKMSKRALRKMRPQMQMIFQDPYSSLSPRIPVGEIIGEAVKSHKIVPKNRYQAYILKVMHDCGLQPQYFY